MKPRPSPNWREYDNSGRVIRQRFYSTDARPDRIVIDDPAPLSPRELIAARKRFLDNIPASVREVAPVVVMARLHQPELFAQLAKPPRPRRAK